MQEVHQTARPAAGYRAALEAIREALDIPHAATVGEDEIRARILDQRVMHAVGMLRVILRENPAPVAWAVDYLQERLTEHPATGYKTWDERIAELRAAEDAAAEHAAASCEMCGASGASEQLDRSVWTALADGTKTVRWLCTDRKACTGRRFPGLTQMLGEPETPRPADLDSHWKDAAEQAGVPPKFCMTHDNYYWHCWDRCPACADEDDGEGGAR